MQYNGLLAGWKTLYNVFLGKRQLIFQISPLWLFSNIESLAKLSLQLELKNNLSGVNLFFSTVNERSNRDRKGHWRWELWSKNTASECSRNVFFLLFLYNCKTSSYREDTILHQKIDKFPTRLFPYILSCS